VSAAALEHRDGLTRASARARLAAAERAGLLAAWSPMTGVPTLYTVTREGARVCVPAGAEPAQVAPAAAAHAVLCASVAVALEAAYPGQLVVGERELRRRERLNGALLASIRLGAVGPLVHRPDLVVWPAGDGSLPVAVEVELTVKSRRRLTAICAAWARARHVSGALYVVSAQVRDPLERAIADSGAATAVTVVDLDGQWTRGAGLRPRERTVAGDA
jgi:hypothetical protein